MTDACTPMSSPSLSAAGATNRTLNHKHHHTIYHSQFASRDKTDTIIPPNVKASIIDHSPKRQPIYEPDKVLVRTEQRFSCRDASTVAAEKTKRILEVQHCGFASDGREPYRPLGDPILDIDQLMSERLRLGNIMPKSVLISPNKDLEDKTKDPATQTRPSSKPQSVDSRLHDGYDVWTKTLQDSRGRLFSVKFGIRFRDACPNASPPGKTSNKVKENFPFAKAFDPSKIDLAKEAFYEQFLDPARSLALRRSSFMVTPRFSSSRESIVHCNPSDFSPTNHWESSKVTAGASLVLPRPLSGAEFAFSNFRNSDTGISVIRSASDSSARSSAPPTGNPGRDREMMALEKALGIDRSAATDSTRKLCAAKKQYLRRKEELNYDLSRQLLRLDNERFDMFSRKYKAFKVEPTTVFVDDLARMRRQTKRQQTLEHVRQLHEHSWYNDMVKTVVNGNGMRTTPLSGTEQTVLKRIRRVIEENIAWNKSVLITLFKGIPLTDFPIVQKIARYIKTAESMAERDYLEAIEQSAHIV